MIGKHLWTTTGKWKFKESRVCLKCGARVTFMAQPRYGSNVYATEIGYERSYGAMSKCEPLRFPNPCYAVRITHAD